MPPRWRLVYVPLKLGWKPASFFGEMLAHNSYLLRNRNRMELAVESLDINSDGFPRPVLHLPIFILARNSDNQARTKRMQGIGAKEEGTPSRVLPEEQHHKPALACAPHGGPGALKDDVSLGAIRESAVLIQAVCRSVVAAHAFHKQLQSASRIQRWWRRSEARALLRLYKDQREASIREKEKVFAYVKS
jgi:hypothetical protein